MLKRFIFLHLLAIALTCSAGNNNNDAANNHNITIMTYNIKMLPRGATFLHHYPVKRARLIPEKILAESPDVIVFEEAFDGAAIRALNKRLRSTYPFMAGQHNRRVITYKRAGGVLIYSKYPLKELESIGYSQCKGADCLGHKGAILVEVEHPVHKFQLLGTHLQAGSNHPIKISQYQEIAALIERHTQPDMPQFIAGDFNTHKDDTTLYTALVSTINAEDGTVDNEEQALQAHAKNDMRNPPNPKKKKGIIDYVFIKANGTHILSQQRYTRQFQQQWSPKHKDLSDHFAVILKVKI